MDSRDYPEAYLEDEPEEHPIIFPSKVALREFVADEMVKIMNKRNLFFGIGELIERYRKGEV